MNNGSNGQTDVVAVRVYRWDRPLIEARKERLGLASDSEYIRRLIDRDLRGHRKAT